MLVTGYWLCLKKSESAVARNSRLTYRSSVADGPSGETDYKQQMEEKPRSQIEVRILVCSVSKTNSALPIKMSENL